MLPVWRARRRGGTKRLDWSAARPQYRGMEPIESSAARARRVANAPDPTAVRALMQRLPLFAALPADGLAALCQRCRVKHLAAGEEVFSPLDAASAFYAILVGRIKVYQLSPKGDEQILHLYGAGQTFGEAAMLAGGAYPAYATALEATTLVAVARDALRATIAGNPDLALAMLGGLASKLHEFNRLIEQLSLRDVPARLARTLLDLAAEQQGDRVRLVQSKRELAAQIGTIPETLSRALRRLREAGLVAVQGEVIHLLDRDQLTQWAGGEDEP